MALKIVDGFDHYNNSTDFLARSGFLQWQFPTAAPVGGLSFVTGLQGVGKAVQWGVAYNIGEPDQTVRGVIANRDQEGYHAFRFNIPLGTSLIVGITDTVAGAPQLGLFFNAANYSIAAYLGNVGGTLLQLSANNVWIGATNQFVEIHFKIASSGGVLQVKMRSTDTVINVSSANTQNTANAWADAIDLKPSITGFGTATWKMDDYKYNDTTSDSGSSANNGFMGDVGTYTKFATGDGTVQWTPDSGSAHYSRVNEQAMDGDTSYNLSATAGQEDQLTFQPITQVVALIYGVFVTIAARKDDVGPRVIKTGLKSGATTSYGSNHSVPDTYAYFTDLWVLDPNTSANWTRTNFNNVLGLYNLVS